MCLHGDVLRDRSAMSLNTRGDLSKQVPNSPILRNNHELDSLVLNKGQIH